MKNVLTESLAIVRPLLPPPLFSPEIIPRLWEAAEALVPIPPLRLGFECRLAADAPEVDVQQGIARNIVEPAMLAEHVGAIIASRGAAHPAWERIRSFCEAWQDPGSPLHEIGELWLECDLVDATASLPAPSVFFGLNQQASPAMQSFPVAEAALDLFMGGNVPPGLLKNLRRCYEACGDRAIVSHLGVMLSRDVELLRVNIKRLPADEYLSWLADLGWPGGGDSVAELLAGLCSFVDAMTLCLDVGRDFSPRAGFECFLQWQPGREARWAAFIGNLVERGMCAPDKADALMHWPGYTDPASTAVPWPGALIAQSLAQNPERFTVLNREIMHIKVTWQPQRAPEAKAYFGFLQSWLVPETESPTPPKIETGRASSNDLAAAMEAAVAFLLRARTQTGWWQEYDGFEEGPSDEWGTAYVATTLATMRDGRADRAARWAWRLLTERRKPSEGWGWNIVLPSDADSTLWALRLAENIGAGHSAHAELAREFLRRHTLWNGGVATYIDDYFRSFTGHFKTPPKIQKWFDAHTCVTAGAGVRGAMGAQARPFLREAQRKDGSWKGYWWPDDEYTTMLSVESLAESHDSGDRRRVQLAFQWATDRISASGAVCPDAHPNGSAFSTACCVRILRLVENRDTPPSQRAIDWLLEHQRADGSWAPAATLYANPEESPVRPILETRGVFTTATVIAALRETRG